MASGIDTISITAHYGWSDLGQGEINYQGCDTWTPACTHGSPWAKSYFITNLHFNILPSVI